MYSRLGLIGGNPRAKRSAFVSLFVGATESGDECAPNANLISERPMRVHSSDPGHVGSSLGVAEAWTAKDAARRKEIACKE